MEKSFTFYYGLSILDALNLALLKIATPTASPSQVSEKTLKGIELRDATVEMMKSPQTTPFIQFQHKVDAYFGERCAANLFNLVHKLYQVAHAHMLQRATDGPYDIHPNEFAVFLTQRVRYIMIDDDRDDSDSESDDDENDPDWEDDPI
jgi:hypothetical protein